MQDTYKKLEEWFLFFLIILMPVTRFPEQFKIPFLGNNIPVIINIFMTLILIIWMKKNSNWKLPYKKFAIIFSLWAFICLLIGTITFPFWDERAENFLKSAKLIQQIKYIAPAVADSYIFLHLKYGLSVTWYLIRDYLFPLFSVFYVIYFLYGKNKWEDGVNWVSKAALAMTCLMGIYSFIEVIWIWTNSELASNILIAINSHLYDIKSLNGWWPPALWKGQLRSYTMEPSFFGIFASFLFPFLIYRVWYLHKKKEVVFLILLVFMIFMTKARTAIVIYLIEALIIILITLLVRCKNWGKISLGICGVTIISFLFYLLGTIYFGADNTVNVKDTGSVHKPAITTQSIKKESDKYVTQNINSVAEVGQRSNIARFGNSIAMAKVGIEHPIFGVGQGYQNMYMRDLFPEFSKNNIEIKNWTKDLDEKGFMQAGYPILNTFSAVLAQTGFIGLILFLLPIFYVLVQLMKNRYLLQNFSIVCLLGALMGQMGCMLSNWYYLTYPIVLSLLICCIDNEKRVKELKNN